MSASIKYHDSVITSDGHLLGVAQRIYHADPDDGISTQPYSSYLKVFDFSMGDSFYVPLDFVSDNKEDGNLHLTLDFQEVQSRLFSNTPRAIAYGAAESESLTE